MDDIENIYDPEPEQSRPVKPEKEPKAEPNPEDLESAEEQEAGEGDGEEGVGKSKRSLPKTPWQKEQEADAQEAKELRDSLKSTFNESLEEDDAEDTGFYRGDGDKKGTGRAKKAKGKIRRLLKNKFALGGLGMGIAGLVIGSFALFNFLNFYKLEHLMNNISAKSFARINATFEHRSDKWMRAYIQIRLAEFRGTLSKADGDNLWIKANKVDTNRPLVDWYRTMRTNGFEERILNKRGIFFTSTMTPDGNVAYAKIQIGDKEKLLNFNAGLDTNGNKKKFSSLDSFKQNQILGNINYEVSELFDGPGASKQMRGELRKAVKDETRFFQVLKRRHMRKYIQNKIGVSDWKFFEKTRNKITGKKSEIQKKLLRKLIPQDTKSGRFMLCIFGAGPCPKNADANNAENKVAKSFSGTGTEGEGEKVATDDKGNVELDEDNNPIKGEVGTNTEASKAVSEATEKIEKEITEGVIDGVSDEAANALVRAEILNSIMTKVNIVTAVVSIVKTMDTLSRIDHNIVDTHSLTKIAVLAKEAQAASAFTTYAIMASQVHPGQLTAEEYNTVMQGFKGAENSEAYDYFFNQRQNVASALKSKDEFCDTEYVPQPEDYYWNCDSTKIGGVSNGTKIEEAYSNSIGKVLHPLAVGYREVRNTPGVKQVFDFTNWLSNSLSGLVSEIVNPILDALGLSDDIAKAMVWLTGKLMEFLGAGPILTGVNDAAGLTLTMIGQGSAVVAEGSMRSAGAGISNTVSKAYTDKLTLAYLDEENQNKSFSERYLALENPDSLFSKAAFDLSNLDVRKLGSISKWFGNSVSNLGRILSPAAKAQSIEGGAAFAGIDSYDFPVACMELDPLTVSNATDMTNADNLVNEEGKPFIESGDINIDLLGNADAFWAKVYERVGDNDFDTNEVLKVYNCETLEQQVRGSLGFTSGYTTDNGLNDGISFLSGSSGPTGTPIDCSSVAGNEKIICAAKNFLGVRYANRNEGTGAKWLNEWGVSTITGSLGQKPQEWISQRVFGGPNDFFECSGFTKTAIYAAFGVTVNAQCSGAYLTDSQYFKEIDMSELRPGDLLVESTECGNGGHVGIYLGITDTGMVSTIESSAGKNANTGEKKSGFYERPAGAIYKYAVRYIGPGSSP